MGTLSRIVSLAILALMLISMIPLSNPSVATQSVSQNKSVPMVTLVKLWQVSHRTYMAKFVGEDYVVVFESHGDVSLDGRLVSTWKYAWIYEVRTGKLLGTLAPGTYIVKSWKPFEAIKVWDYNGFFSADSKRMVEDPRVRGTNAVILDTASWKPIAIDWGFTADGTHFYAAQLDYDGSVLAVGYIGQDGVNDTAKLLVFRYDPTQNKYVKIFEHAEFGDYGRRLQMTLDGKYILIGGLFYPYLDIWEWDDGRKTYVRVVQYRLPDTGGITALGISDPWNVGYVIIGTYNGWVIIAHFNAPTNEFKVLYRAKLAPPKAQFYNPFYDRWIPKVTEVFALASKAGIGVIYDLLANQTIVINYGGDYGYWKAASVSPEGNYVFLGNALYMVVKRDVYSGKPRIRFWGTMHYEREHHEMSTPIVIEAPQRDWKIYFVSGRVKIRVLYLESVPVDLVKNDDVKYGKLAKMYERGLINPVALPGKNAEVQRLAIYPGTYPDISALLAEEGVGNPDHYVATFATVKFNPPPYFETGVAYYATIIDVPLGYSLALYNDMRMQANMNVHTWLLYYDKDKRALGVVGIPVTIGSPPMGYYAFSRVASRVLAWRASQEGISGASRLAGIVTAQTATKVAGIVGLAVFAWGALDYALIQWGGFGEVYHRSLVIVAPVVVDKSGNKYTAIVLVLPREASGDVDRYYDAIKKLFESEGFKDVGLRVDYPCGTWDEYKRLMTSGYTANVSLYNLIRETIASKYGLSMNDLVIAGIKIVILTEMQAKQTFWEWLFGFGGIYVDGCTLIGASYIQVKALLRKRTVTDPAGIAALVGKVYVNGKEYSLVPSPDGAYADFALPAPSSAIVVSFGKATGYYGDIDIELRTVLVKTMEPLEDFGYTTGKIHYDWSNTLIRIDRIEFVDMPYPMVKAERIFIYKYGNFTNDITHAFELQRVVNSSLSPSGKFYYYVTTRNTLYIDPANGGTLMPCKTFIFNYYYRQPPDASIVVYFNGTRITSTLAHHATVVINSTAEQDVGYSLTITVAYLDGTRKRVLATKTYSDTVHVPANGSAYRIYDIAQFVDMAIEFAKSSGKVAFVEVVGRITKARYDYIKENDEWRAVYYPPPTLPPPMPSGNFTVTIEVLEYDAEHYRWIPSANATVRAYLGTDINASRLVYTATTNASGIAVMNLSSGTWTFVASKPGFYDAVATVPIYNDTILRLYLAPAPQPSAENRSYVGENVTVIFNVYDATTGAPVSGAVVNLTYAEPSSSSYYNTTFTATTDASGIARLRIPIGIYNATIEAVGYVKMSARYVLDEDAVINVPLVPASIDPAQYAKLEVHVLYADGKPYEGARVYFYNASSDALIASLTTDSFGIATMVLPKGQSYNVVVKVVEPFYNRSYTDSQLVVLGADTAIAFVVPWNSSQAPERIDSKPYYWLSVQVLWSNGLPFHGAVVEVYNYTTKDLIASGVTNGTGTVHFLLPAFELYTIHIRAANPYNANQIYENYFVLNLSDNRWISVRLPWTPEQPGLSKRYRIYVYTYDVVTGAPVANATVIVRKGDVAWIGETNATGYAEVWLPFLGMFNVTAIHEDYQAVWRLVQIYENDSVVSIPMSPVPLSHGETPPINGTPPPPININGTYHYWLSVQVLWNDGYPFQGALVSIYNYTTGNLVARQKTDATGFAHFLLPANSTIRVVVNATNPETNETFHDERIVTMNQHYYLTFVVPWNSTYYSPEVWLVNATFVIHRGQGYLFGNVSHLVLLSIWTNKAQNVTVLLALYNVDEGRFVNNETVTLSLHEGYGTYFTWISVNASQGGRYRVFVNITRWEYDTDPSNNYLWTNTVYLKPFVDIQVFVVWRPIKQKLSYAILPEDLVEIDIGVKIPINTSSMPAKLRWSIEALDLETMKPKTIKGGEEDVRVVEPGIVWRNVTVAVPWTSKIFVYVNATHPWEDAVQNNVINVTIPIDPDISLKIVSKPTVVPEGSEFAVVINITSNVEHGKAIAWVSLEDNTTKKLLIAKDIKVAPRKTVELRVKAPENPTALWIIRVPSTKHLMVARVSGYDVYGRNNEESFEVTVVSNQWLVVALIVAVLFAVALAIKIATHTVATELRARKRFVATRSKRFVTAR